MVVASNMDTAMAVDNFIRHTATVLYNGCMITTNKKSLQEHMESIAPKGGKALFAKVGSKGMSDLVKKRWAKRSKKKSS